MELGHNNNNAHKLVLSVFFCHQVAFYPFGIHRLFTRNVLSKILMIIFYGDRHLDSNIFRISLFGVFVIAISHLPMNMLKFHRVPDTVHLYSIAN